MNLDRVTIHTYLCIGIGLLLFGCSGGDGGGSIPASSSAPTVGTQTAPAFIQLRFLKAVTDSVHTDAVMQDGPPLIGSNALIQATLAGVTSSPTPGFVLVDEAGSTLSSVSLILSGRSTVQPLDFVGRVTVPTVPFKVVASGTAIDGRSFSLKSAVINPMNMGIGFVPRRVLLARGATTTTQLEIQNSGSTATFLVHFNDPLKLLPNSQDTFVSVGAGRSVSIPVTVNFPISLTSTSLPVVTATASVSGDIMRIGTAALTLMLDGAP